MLRNIRRKRVKKNKKTQKNSRNKYERKIKRWKAFREFVFILLFSLDFLLSCRKTKFNVRNLKCTANWISLAFSTISFWTLGINIFLNLRIENDCVYVMRRDWLRRERKNMKIGEFTFGKGEKENRLWRCILCGGGVRAQKRPLESRKMEKVMGKVKDDRKKHEKTCSNVCQKRETILLFFFLIFILLWLWRCWFKWFAFGFHPVLDNVMFSSRIVLGWFPRHQRSCGLSQTVNRKRRRRKKKKKSKIEIYSDKEKIKRINAATTQ